MTSPHSKVCKFYVANFVNHDVVEFKVSVDNFVFMEVFDR